MNGQGHLPEEISFGYEHGLLTPAELEGVHAHIAACADCRETLAARLGADAMADGLRSSLRVDASRPARPVAFFLAAAAAVIAAVSALWWAQRRSPPTAAAEDDSLEVREALRAGRIPLPVFLGTLAHPREVLMGAPPETPAGAFSPDATAVLGPDVHFRWTPLEGAWTYQVQVFTLDGSAVASSPAVSGSEWTSPAPLSPDASYVWQVTATRGAERLTIPAPPETPPRFRVLDRATSERLRRLVRERPDSAILLGVEFGRAGALDDARRELDRALRRDPRRDDIRRLRRSLDS